MLRVIISTLFLSACSGIPSTPSETTITFTELARTHQAILVGEWHGNNEMPRAFSSFVKDALSTDKRVVVALEYDHTWQADLDTYMKSAPIKGEIPFAARATTDGRTSAAMRYMLQDLKGLSALHPNLYVRAVDWDWKMQSKETPNIPNWIPKSVDTELSRRDIQMGKQAVAACRAVSCELLLYYAGNVHVKISPAESKTFNTETGTITSFMNFPAGAYIAHELPTTAIYLTHRGGLLNAITQTQNAAQMQRRKSIAPDYVVNDCVIYQNADKNSAFPYIMSVGKITSSSDPLVKNQ